MCHRTTCPRCGKATWAGCGAHIEQALRGVPQSERCSCPPVQQKSLVEVLSGLFKPTAK